MSAELRRSPDRRAVWIRAGWVLVGLISVWMFAGTIQLTRQFADALPPRVAEGLQRLGVSHEAYFWFSVATITPVFAGFFLVALAIFWLRPQDRMAVFTSIFLMTFGAANAFVPAKEYLALVAAAPLTYTVPYFVTGMLSFGLVGVFFALFPDGQFVPGWMRWIALQAFLFSLVYNLFPATVGVFEGPLGIASLLAAVVMFAGSLLGQVWRYRNHATPVQKQQTKWFVFGLALIVGFLMLPSIFIYSLPAAQPETSLRFDAFVSIANLAFIFLPLSIGIAIFRYRLWDIDLIIRRTLTYSLISALLALTYFGSVIVLQSLLRAMTGQAQSQLAAVVSTLGIAALFVPLRARVQAAIDRRFYRSKYDAARTLADFAAAARDETDLDSLRAQLIGVVEEAIRPESVGLWLRPGSDSQHRKAQAE